MNDREIDKLLSSAEVPQGPKAETLGRIAQSIAESMGPVRVLPPRWMLTGGAVLICAIVALSGAVALGFAGIVKMTALERGTVIPAVAILVLASASELVSTIVPGSRRRFSSGALLMVASLCLAAVLAACFRDYQTTHFMHAGLVCLAVGLVHAIAAGLLSWLVLRRCVAMDAVSSGLAGGTLAGLAGLGMLELHCPNFQAAHVLVWHLGVLLMSAGLGVLFVRVVTLNSSIRKNRNW